MSVCTFRPGQASDWKQVRQLLEACDLPLDGAKEHLPAFLLAYSGEELAGCGGLEHYDEAVLLRSVAVGDPWRGIGLGTELVERLLAKAWASEARTVVLLTTTAPDFFTRFGFTWVERDSVPAAAQASVEFQGACPDSAIVMRCDRPVE